MTPTPRTFRSRLAILFGMLFVLVGLPTYLYVSKVHRDQLVAERLQNLQGVTTSAATVIAENLIERRREIELLAQTSTCLLYTSPSPRDS